MRNFTFFLEGEKAFKSKNYEKAIKQFRKFLKFNPKRPEAYNNIVVCYSILKDIKNVVKTLDEMLENNIEEHKSINNKKQLQITKYFFENNIDITDTDSKVDVLQYIDILEPKYINTIISNSESINNQSKIAIIKHIYFKEPSNIDRHYIGIRFMIELYCSQQNYDIFVMKNAFMKNNNYYYIGLCEYFQGFFKKALIFFNKQAETETKTMENVSVDVKNINSFFILSSILRSADGSQEQYELIKDIYKTEIANGNSNVDEWWYFSAYNVYEEFNKDNAKESFDYICDLNKRTNERINMNLVTDFAKFKETNNDKDKLEIAPIDKTTQIVTLKNCKVFTHMNAIMIIDDKNLFVGKNDFYTYTTEYVTLKKNVVNIKGKVFSLNICNQTNYFHILIELLTRICILEKYYNQDQNQDKDKSLKDITIIVSKNIPSYGKEILNLFNFKEIIYYNNDTYQCEELIYVDIGVESDEYKDCWGSYLPSKLAIDTTFEKFTNLYGGETQDKIVYISRSNTNIRNVVNEELMINEVLKPLYGDNLVIFDNNYLKNCNPNEKFKSQVALFNQAKLVISPHGAGLTNILFCKKGTPVIEFSMKPNCNRCFEYIAKYRDLDYRLLKIFTSFYHTNYTFEQKHVNEFRMLLENINATYNI